MLQLSIKNPSRRWRSLLIPLLAMATQACTGADGKDGAAGLDGADGVDGADGSDGEDGEDGVAGPGGLDGRDGQDGLSGLNGAAGPNGANGLDGRNGLDGLVRPVVSSPSSSGGGVPQLGVPQALTLSATGNDAFYGAAYDDEGNIYATGHVATDIGNGADHSFVLAKFLASGELDESFGNEGVVTVNVAPGGTNRELARGILVQSDGKIVIAGGAEHDPSAAGLFATDMDIFLVRFNTNGTLDTTFGADGIARLDLSTAVEGTNNSGAPALLASDSVWTIAAAADDTIVVHGTQRAEGLQVDGVTPRVDADWALLRLTAEGDFDTRFGADGKVTLDIAGAGASARAVTVLTNNSIVAAGYLSSSALGVSTQQPVIYKVDASGEFDSSFATTDAWTAPGVWHDLAVAPPLRAEAYGAALQGDKLVTMGYGPTPSLTGTGSDWVSFRYTANGDLDTTYGEDLDANGTPDGRTYIDAGGFGDNGRFVMTLPDQRILAVGGGRLSADDTDAMVAILNEDGTPDTDFAPGGFELYDVAGTNDFFWGGAVSPNRKRAAVVGIAGATTSVNDTDSALLILSLE